MRIRRRQSNSGCVALGIAMAMLIVMTELIFRYGVAPIAIVIPTMIVVVVLVFYDASKHLP